MTIRKTEGAYVIPLSFSEMHMSVAMVGDDCQITVYGGDTPHIGSVVLAVPRESLSGDGTLSATSSVINVVGHKDEAVLRLLAEKCAAAWNNTVVCSGGFHVDHISKTQIDEVVDACERIEWD